MQFLDMIYLISDTDIYNLIPIPTNSIQKTLKKGLDGLYLVLFFIQLLMVFYNSKSLKLFLISSLSIPIYLNVMACFE